MKKTQIKLLAMGMVSILISVGFMVGYVGYSSAGRVLVSTPTTLHISNYEPVLGTPQAIAKWIDTNINYKPDIDQWGVKDYHQTPRETLRLKTGDCEDLSLLFQHFLFKINKIGIVLFMKHPTKGGHAICVYIDKLRYRVFDNDEILNDRFISLEEVAKHYGTVLTNKRVNIEHITVGE